MKRSERLDMTPSFRQNKKIVPALRSHVLPCMDHTIIEFKTLPWRFRKYIETINTYLNSRIVKSFLENGTLIHDNKTNFFLSSNTQQIWNQERSILRQNYCHMTWSYFMKIVGWGGSRKKICWRWKCIVVLLQNSLILFLYSFVPEVFSSSRPHALFETYSRWWILELLTVELIFPNTL